MDDRSELPALRPWQAHIRIPPLEALRTPRQPFVHGERARVPVHAARACLVRDQESTFGRVNRKAINEFNSNKPGIRRRTPSPEKRRRTPQRYDDDGDVRMSMPPPAPSETNQLATGPVSAAQEARDLAEALRRSREDAAPAPAPAEPSPTPFSGHALLQGLMQG